jgi:hypothetical protein
MEGFCEYGIEPSGSVKYFHYCYSLVYSILIYLIAVVIVFVVVENHICIVFILYSVFFIACVVLCAVFCLSVVCCFV